jgi:DinB family protein
MVLSTAVVRASMHPRIAELLRYIDEQAAGLRAAFEAVPPDRRALRPAPGRWSPAEVVHHVTIVERRVVQRIRSFIQQTPAIPPEQDTSPILSTLRTARPVDRTKRFVTSDAGEPRETDATRVWDEFEETRRALKDVIATGDGLAFGSVSATHPGLGELNGYEWIAFAGFHAARHADQIREDAQRNAEQS